MLYLVDEFYKQKDKTITITFGKSISYKTFDHRHPRLEWADRMRDFIYLLKDNPEQKFLTD